jgi:hypothetical protein
LRNFSYSFNGQIPRTVAGRTVHPKPGQVLKPAEKILIYEEFAPNDGHCSGMWSTTAASGDMPSGRHGNKRQNANASDAGGIRDTAGRGNHIFFDGHLESLYIDELIGTPNRPKHDPIWNP